MPTSRKNISWAAHAAVAVASALYVYLSFAAPTSADSNALNLSELQLVLIRLTIFIPYILSWFAGLSGSVALRRCGEWLRGEESSGFRLIANAVAVFVVGSLLSSLVGSLRSYFDEGTVWRVAVSVVNNYVYVGTALVAAIVFFKGARKLVHPKQDERAEKDDKVMSAVITVILACLYIPLVFTNPYRQIPAASGQATYYLPDVVIVLTIVLPLIVTWYVFLAAMFRFNRYVLPISNEMRRRGLKGLFHGLWLTLFASIFLQILISLGSQRLTGAGLGFLLAIIYVLVGLQVVGFILIYFGAKHVRDTLEASNPQAAPATEKQVVPLPF